MSRQALATFFTAAALVLACVPRASLGDDTDVYIDNTRTVPPTSLPMVMFSIDYRANLGSTICSNPTDTTSCPQALFFRDNGLVLSEYTSGGGTSMTFFDLLRASLRIVLRESKGFKAGLMLNHNNTALAARDFTVANTAACPNPQVAIQGAAVREGDRGTNSIAFTVTLSAGCEGSVIELDYTTSDGSATDPADYTATREHLIFDNSNINPKRPVYDTTKTIVVPVVPDTETEGDHTFTVTLSNLTTTNRGSGSVSASFVTGADVATGFIEDDDGGGAVACSGPLSGSTVCSNGGYIARYLGPDSAINSTVGIGQTDHDQSRIELLKIIDSLPPTGGSISQPYQGKELFFEFYRYLTGQDVYNGASGWFDYNTDSTTNLARRGMSFSDPVVTFTDETSGGGGDNLNVGRDDRAASTTAAGRTYISPLRNADACAKIFTINFLFGVSNTENDSDSAINDSLARGGFEPAVAIPGDNTGFSKVISYLNDTDVADGRHGNAPTLDGVQNVTSFFISLPTPENSDPPAFDSTTVDYARAGGTKAPLPLAKDPARLVAAIRNALEQILSVSTTFVSAAVPVNVFNRAEIVNNLYFSVFQAEAGANWTGNLKKLKLGVSTGGDPIIVDSITESPDLSAISSDGRIANDALTYWTATAGGLLDTGDTNSDGTTDNFSPPGSNTAANPANYFSDRDGRHIARGGAGQRIPGFTSSSSGPGATNPGSGTIPSSSTARRAYYLNLSSSAAALDDLDSSITTAESALVKTQLGNASMSNAEMTNLVNYARGLDVTDADADRSGTDSRFWIMGDSLHARPLPINYGFCCGYTANSDPTIENASAIFIVLASNDGHVRMIRNTGNGPAASASELGEEVWTFVPPEGMLIQNQLLRETPTTVPFHPFAADGEPAALVLDQNGNGSIECDSACDGSALDDRVLLYFGMRRGGTAYYALDITDPYVPKFLWRIDPSSRTTSAGYVATTDFSQLAQSFSRPRIGSVLLGSTSGVPRRRLAMFFGGGYYGGYTGAIGSDGKPVRLGNDVDGAIGNDTAGNSIFVVRADNAQLIWKAVGPGPGGTLPSASATVFPQADLLDSVPSNMTIADTDADGAIDRIVVGDTGGNIWRADLNSDNDNSTDPTQAQTTDDWTLRRLACLGRHGGANCADVTGTAAVLRANDRRFFHEPDLVQARDNAGRYDAVIIGSGDREDPLDQGGNGIVNYLYVVKDRNVGIGQTQADDVGTTDDETLIDQGELGDVTNQCVSGTTCTVDLTEGWKLQLDHTPASEKVLSAAVTVANNIFFTTYLPPPATPPPGSCGPQEGGGFLYAIKLENGAPAKNYDEDATPNEKSDRAVSLDTPGIPAQVVFLGSSTELTNSGPSGGCTLNLLAGAQIFEAPGCPRYRTFWQRLGN